jgi:phospholipid transport system transporter-binding protein
MAESDLTLRGDLTVSDVGTVHRHALKARRAGRLPEQIDLSDVNRSDSAGLALLLELKAWASADGRPLSFTNPPDSLRVLAELSQADGLLGWSTENC